jgi:hypothetical protein
MNTVYNKANENQTKKEITNNQKQFSCKKIREMYSNSVDIFLIKNLLYNCIICLKYIHN